MTDDFSESEVLCSYYQEPLFVPLMFYFLTPADNKASAATTDGGAGDPDAGSAAGRKRRWGSSTAVTAKKPSISITTDSLKVPTHHREEGLVSNCSWNKLLLIFLG